MKHIPLSIFLGSSSFSIRFKISAKTYSPSPITPISWFKSLRISSEKIEKPEPPKIIGISGSAICFIY